MSRGGERTFAVPGQRFGCWTVIGDDRSGFWICRCDCGTIKPVAIAVLVPGRTKSCGCRGKDWCTTHGMDGTPIYFTWAGMIQRCENPKSGAYNRYGGRGIKICPEWRASFETFMRDMGPCPGEGWTVGRIDNDGDYCPTNCQWETKEQQARNRSNTKFLTIDGEIKPLAEWAEIYGIRRRLVAERIRQGWTDFAALTTPARRNSGASRYWAAREVK